MQLELNLKQRPGPSKIADALLVQGRIVPLLLVRNPKARRYILRLNDGFTARVTIPRGGSKREARAFARKHVDWLAGQIAKHAARKHANSGWQIGRHVLFRGELTPIRSGARANQIRLGSEMIAVQPQSTDLRPDIERHLQDLAVRELPPLVMKLAREHGEQVHRVTIRAQRTRWGSCSRNRTISLNWRLVQTPTFVRDYIVLHELMHLREMNHSARYWKQVARVFPDYRRAERWLREHPDILQGS